MANGPINLDDAEQLAQAAMLGFVTPVDVEPAQLVRLGRAHIELLARVESMADKAQATVLELEHANKAALREIEQLRAVVRALRALISTGKIASPVATDLEAVELLVDTATLLAGTNENARVALLVGALSQACLQHTGPDGAFDAASESLGGARASHAELRAQPIERPS
jgi:multidrug resistance efflux pump